MATLRGAPDHVTLASFNPSSLFRVGKDVDQIFGHFFPIGKPVPSLRILWFLSSVSSEG